MKCLQTLLKITWQALGQILSNRATLNQAYERAHLRGCQLMPNRQKLFKALFIRLGKPVIKDGMQTLTLSRRDRKKNQLSHDRLPENGDDQAPRDTVSPWGKVKNTNGSKPEKSRFHRQCAKSKAQYG